ncbi:MAG: beta-ketoacyl-ACP synthase III [Pseudanabaenaceae cyanobacterium SKYGB_i_bin29]|nr:ketoacyl-ACP synthase III [Pseudanabaenaceae cyanobacterium SKYG29]MDW8421293.1 beta-ketoacyl-ACP synthase III [Pseudanabaenaceae cyanobacterium SKYGB_i_bin29]
MRGVRIWGHGAALPQRVITNDEIAQQVETSDEWIFTRTGIKERRIAAKSPDALVQLAVEAGMQTLTSTGIAPQELDLILLTSSTPDDLFGSAAQVQQRLGANRSVAFDLTAACSGFVFGLITAAQFVRAGTYRHILVIGADVLSRWVDWQDRRTCILFGDGAGAALVSQGAGESLLGFAMATDGKGYELLNLPYDPDRACFAPIYMNGREVYRFAVTKVPETIEAILQAANHQPQEIDWYILHQANQRIIDAVAERLGVEPRRMVSNIAQVGNTSAASIPIALAEYVRAGQIKPGDKIMAVGFGAGLSWGGILFQWG